VTTGGATLILPAAPQTGHLLPLPNVGFTPLPRQ
jgi:hypothetical protein